MTPIIVNMHATNISEKMYFVYELNSYEFDLYEIALLNRNILYSVLLVH